MDVVQALAVAGLMLVHVFAGRLRVLERRARRAWISLAGGMSIAYVFVHLLPELQVAQGHLGDVPAVDFLQHHAYVVALAGLVVWYGLERLARRAQPRPTPDARGRDAERRGDRNGAHTKDRRDDHREETGAPLPVFWLHVGSFAVYNGLVGYLIAARELGSARALLTFALVMALHFAVNDNALRREHKDTYRHAGRWLLSASVLGGWLLGNLGEMPDAASGLLFAFLAGGIILNVLKEELPEEREGQFWPFVLGAFGYAVLLLLE